ncbi:MAG: sigma-70 family RNA polymerase sigma factor [Pseudomonadota bacterium]
MQDDGDITQLLNQWTGGDSGAGDKLAPLVYNELRRRAGRVFAGEKPGHTLQPTALVNEAFASLVNAQVTWKDRAHFFALAARMMRRLLVNHATAKLTEKRGGGVVKVTLDPAAAASDDNATELVRLNDALQSLGELDPRKAELIELQYFGGLTFAEMEQVTGLSSSTLDRHLRMARAWLKDALIKP